MGDWLEEDPERILIYSEPKVGKTWAACSFIEAFPDRKFYYVNTDGGFVKTFKNYFGDKVNEVKERVEYIRVSDLKKAIKDIQEVINKADRKDWIILDLISDFWEMAQDEFMEQSAKAYGGDIVEYILNASKDKAKFGLFSGIQWQYIKRLDNMITFDLLGKNPPCNILGLAATKSTDVEEAFAKIEKTKEVPQYLSEYEEIGKRPAGQKQLGYKFNSVVYLPKRGEFYVVGTRELIKEKRVKYDRSFAKAWYENVK